SPAWCVLGMRSLYQSDGIALDSSRHAPLRLPVRGVSAPGLRRVLPAGSGRAPRRDRASVPPVPRAPRARPQGVARSPGLAAAARTPAAPGLAPGLPAVLHVA